MFCTGLYLLSDSLLFRATAVLIRQTSCLRRLGGTRNPLVGPAYDTMHNQTSVTLLGDTSTPLNIVDSTAIITIYDQTCPRQVLH